MPYCVLVHGKVIAEIYDSFLDHLAEKFKNESQVVFSMDNAKIHEHDAEKFKNSKYKMLFNTPYSSELNPIENIVGTWKNMIKPLDFPHFYRGI